MRRVGCRTAQRQHFVRSISSQTKALDELAADLDLPIRTHAAALFFESVARRQVDQIASHGRFPIEAVGSIEQHFMERRPVCRDVTS